MAPPTLASRPVFELATRMSPRCPVVALALLSCFPAITWASGPGVGRVEPADVGQATCYGWSSATDSAFVMRQKETCAAEGCTLGAYLARVGPNSRAQTVSYVGVAKNPSGRAQLSVLVASAKPKFTAAASEAVAKEADHGCLTEQPDVSVAVQGHALSGGAEGTNIVVRVDGRVITVGTLAAAPVAERVEAIHYAPDYASVLVRVRAESDLGSDVRYVHVSASKLGLTAPRAATPEAPQAPPGKPPPADPSPVHEPPADPLAAPREVWGWPSPDGGIGWSSTTLSFYAVREREGCNDDASLDCSRSVAMIEVTPKRARSVRALLSAQGDRNTVGQATIPEARYKGFNTASKADLGYAVGLTGTLPGGHKFEVSVEPGSGEQTVALSIDGGPRTTVAVLANRERREDMYGDVHPGVKESLAAVYGHPAIAALVIEIHRETDVGSDARYVYLDASKLQPRVARVGPAATNETPEEAARTPLTRLAVSMPGRRCLGWSKASATAYVVAAKDYCIDAGGEECDASSAVQAVSSAGTKMVASLGSAHGDLNTVEGRLARAATDAVLDAAEKTVTPLLEVG